MSQCIVPVCTASASLGCNGLKAPSSQLPISLHASHAGPAAGQTVGPRLIPLEPAYILLNLALSNDFSPVTQEELQSMQFPFHMLVDYVR